MTENGFTGFDLVMRGGGLSSETRATPWDQASQLTESIKLATEFLSPEGAFVTKMFDGARDYSPMLYCLQQLFGSVVVTKPTFTFPETYIVAKSYKAPEKINPRLLVARNLFSIKEDINPEVPWYDRGVHRCRGHRSWDCKDDNKLREIGRDMACGLCGDFDFTETVYNYIDSKVWDKIVFKKSRPSVEKCAGMVERWYASYWKQCVKKGDEVDQACGKEIGNVNHAYLAIAGYEDEGKEELVAHLWSATKLGARRESQYYCVGSGGRYAEVFLKANIKKCTSIDATVDVMKKMFLKSGRYDSRTGGNYKISVIRPHEDIKALRLLPPHKQNTGSIIDEIITLSDLMMEYNDNFDDNLLDQEYGSD
ncbi:hypothetical protein MKW92_000870 [Papaver armeniacum]|nr:hypothetical protein MKW92_000870 [Papaver armeniacum]